MDLVAFNLMSTISHDIAVFAFQTEDKKQGHGEDTTNFLALLRTDMSLPLTFY